MNGQPTQLTASFRSVTRNVLLHERWHQKPLSFRSASGAASEESAIEDAPTLVTLL